MFKRIGTIAVTLAMCIGLAATASATGSLPGSGWWSGEQIQNVGTTAASVTVTAYDSASAATFSSPVTSLAAGASVNFIPSSFAGMASGFVGSAVVSADQPIKAVVNITNQFASGFGVAGGKAAALYQGTESASTTLYFAMAKSNRFNKTTAYYIQNAGAAAATAQVVYKMDDGSVYNFTTPSIGANQMVVVVPTDAGVPTSPSNATRVNIGSATVTSAQPLAGTVLEFEEGQVVATVLKGTRAFTSSDFDTKAYAPIIKNNRFNRFTGIQIQNVGGSPINATIEYVGSANVVGCSGVHFTDVAAAIPAGASRTVNQQAGQSTLIANCTAAATITANGNFIATVNEDNTPTGSVAGITYSARPNNSATTKVVAPQFKESRFGFTTGMQIENVGAATATNVVATFQCRGNNGSNTPFTAISTPKTIVAGGAFLFYKPTTMPAGTFTAGNPFNISGAQCGVTIISDQPVVAILNETPDAVGALDDNNYEGFNIAP
jgi:hypothetical protein